MKHKQRILTSRPSFPHQQMWFGGISVYSASDDDLQELVSSLITRLEDVLKEGLVFNRSYLRTLFKQVAGGDFSDRLFQVCVNMTLHRSSVHKFMCQSEAEGTYGIFVHETRLRDWLDLLRGVAALGLTQEKVLISAATRHVLGETKGGWFATSYAVDCLRLSGVVDRIDRYSFAVQDWVKDVASESEHTSFRFNRDWIPIGQ